MFYNCTNLTTIVNFDTSTLKGTAAMFMNSGLITAPNFNTSNATSMVNMFRFCTKLITGPNFDTSNVSTSGMMQMFYGCYNLVTVYQLNTSKITGMYQTFTSCNNLSDASIQNIINMLLNSNITSTYNKNIINTNSSSPFYLTNIANTRYQNR